MAAGRGSAAASGVLGPSGSSVHARGVWNDVREAVCRRAGTLARVAGDGVGAGFSQVRGLEGLVDLEFVGRLAGHVAGCPRCAGRGAGRDTPEDWLLWAVGRRQGLREVLVPVLMDGAAGGEGGSGGITWNPPGLDLWRKEAARRVVREG